MVKVMVAVLAVGGSVAGGAMVPAAAHAQNVEARVGKLEGEMRAVQRKVFPGGQYLQPEISAPPSATAVPGNPASSAVADLSARVAAVEGQLAQLTGQVEQAQFRNRQLQDQFDTYRRTVDGRLKALEAAPAPAAAPTVGEATPLEDQVPPRRTTPIRPAPPAIGNTGIARPQQQIPISPDTDEAVGRTAPGTAPATAVVKPSTGDAAEDGYLYGYRLWQARRYAEAQTALKKVVADHPKSRRASYAQNLLGRAYLDDGKPSLASMAFYDNYKKMPDGERAPDSLLYLGQALVKLNKPADACKVYGELSDVYGGKLSSSLQAQLTQSRTAARCK